MSTRKTTDIYNFLIHEMMADRDTPNIREICEACDIKSTSNALYHLHLLEQSGDIVREPGMPRRIKLTKFPYGRYTQLMIAVEDVLTNPDDQELRDRLRSAFQDL